MVPKLFVLCGFSLWKAELEDLPAEFSPFKHDYTVSKAWFVVFKRFNTKGVGFYTLVMNRRNVLIGLGGLVAGGGALLGTGAFTTVEAQRTVSVQTAADANAFLALSPARTGEEFVTETDGTIQINLDGTDSNNGNANGLNQNARTRFENLVDVTNNGTQDVTSLTLEVEVSGTNDNAPHEEAFNITVGDDTYEADGTTNILDATDNPSPLTPGNTATFGIEIDLLNNANISEIASGAEFTLTISAETSNS